METATTATGFAGLKNLSYVVAFLVASRWLGFEPETISVLVALMLIDTFTGVTRAYVVNGGTSVKSAIGIKGLLSKLLVLSGLLSFALAVKGVGMSVTGTAQGVVYIFILAETYSILGNVHAAMTRRDKSEYDAISILIRIVRRSLYSLSQDLVDPTPKETPKKEL